MAGVPVLCTGKSCAKTAEPIQIQFEDQTRVESCIRWGAMERDNFKGGPYGLSARSRCNVGLRPN